MAPSKKSTTASTNVDLYDKLISTNPKIERKGAANPYTSLNGNMFTLLHQFSLAIRLPEDQREEFLRKYNTTLFKAYGTVMKEYVAVPDALLKKTKELQKYLEFSYEYTQDTKTQAHKEEVLTDTRESDYPLPLICE
jgi:TfoX/Sxy family transcriptional regulator of competence genes